MSSTLTASCLCGANKIQFDNSPIKKFLCHCHDDRKITGSLFTASTIVPESSLVVLAGTLKTYSKAVDSGDVMENHFCGDCGTTLYRRSDNIPGIVVIKIGTIDDEGYVESWRPDLEQFVKRRAPWVKETEGAEQIKGAWAP